MRERFFERLAGFYVDKPFIVIIFLSFVTLIMGIFALRLETSMSWSNLLPEKHNKTVEFNKIIKEFKSASNIVGVVQGNEKEIKEFADSFSAKVKELTFKNGNKILQRVEYKLEMDFIRKHGLMLSKVKDLKNSQAVFSNPNLSEVISNISVSMEKEYVGNADSVNSRVKEDRAIKFLDGIQFFLKDLQKALYNDEITEDNIKKSVDSLLIGDPYMLSYDKNALIINMIPTFTSTESDLVVEGVSEIQKVLDDEVENYVDVKAGLTGGMPIMHDELVYSEKSLGFTTVLSIVGIYILLVLSFRMWSAPFLALVNLIIGIVWASGISFVAVGSLNIMTSTMLIILLGLGIDFSIHMISAFSEYIKAGDNVQEALEKTFIISGKGIITGGLTTSVAFFTLLISSSKGMKELGLVTGIGILCILFVNFVFLPVILILKERFYGGKSGDFKDTSFKSLGIVSEVLSENYMITLGICFVLGAFFVYESKNIEFDTNYLNMEPRFLESVKLQRTIEEKFDLSMDFGMVLSDSIEESEKLKDAFEKKGSVALVNSISDYIPTLEKQQNRRSIINSIRNNMYSKEIYRSLSEDSIEKSAEIFIQNLDRLNMNIIEMQDMAYLGGQDKLEKKCNEIVGNPEKKHSINIIEDIIKTIKYKKREALVSAAKYQKYFAPYFKKTVLNMCNTDIIDQNTIPESIKKMFISEENNKFLVTVYPAQSVWEDFDFLERFNRELDEVNNKITGMPAVFSALMKVVGKDGRNAFLLTVIVVFILLCIDFRNPIYAGIAMIPLITGTFITLGIMKVIGMKLTVMNVMALPMIVGIGIDDGVHILHRYLYENKGRIRRVFASTGKAVLLTSLTTMLAFGSLGFSVWPGFVSLGVAMFIGVGVCFLCTVIMLSGILGFLGRNRE